MNILPLPVRLWLGRTFFTSFGSCVRISPSRLIKGPTYAGEVEALRLVAEHTSIPVPKVFKVYQRDSGIFIEMEYIRGQNLESIWNTLSDKEKDRFVRELTGQITELRKLKLPTDADPQDAREAGVGSAGMGETMELRLSYEPFGPFKGVEDFHTFVRMNLPLEDTEQSFGTAVYQCHAKRYDVCMTHSDLTLRNMVIDKQGRLTLVDWELAG